MSLVDLNGRWPIVNPHILPEDTTTLATTALDLTGETTGDGIAAVFVPLANKTISGLRGYHTAITGSSPTYRFKLETLSAGRTPSNTPATASCWVDVTPAGAAGWVGGAVVANHSVGADPSPLAVTIRYNSGTCDGSNFATFARGYSMTGDVTSPLTLIMTAGVWGSATTGTMPMLVVEYDDGTIQPLCFYGAGTTPLQLNNSWGTGNAPLHRGNAWTPVVGCEVCGVYITARLPDSFDFRINVYNSAFTLIEQTATFESDKLRAVTSTSFPCFIPLTSFPHAAGTKYYYVLEPTVAVNPTGYTNAIFASRAAIRAIGGDLVGATITSGLVATTFDNGTDGYKLFPIVPVISKIEGGGAKYRPRMRRAG